MNEVELADYRRRRLLDAIDHASHGDKTAFARRLGYRDGAFVRQMLSGTRSISERTVFRIESLPGMKGWFTGLTAPAGNVQQLSGKRAAVLAERYIAADLSKQRVVELVLRDDQEGVPTWASKALLSAIDTALAIAETTSAPECGTPKRQRR